MRARTSFGSALLLCAMITAARGAEIPSEELVRAVREARIAGQLGNAAAQIRTLRKLVHEYPNEILPLLALRDLARGGEWSMSEWGNLKGLFLERLASPQVTLSSSDAIDLATQAGVPRQELAALRSAVERRVAATPESPALLDALATLLHRLEDHDAEHQVLARLDAVRPSAAVRGRRVRLALHMRRPAHALALIQEFRAQPEARSRFRLEAGRALVELGRVAEARAEIAPLLADKGTPSGEVIRSLLPAAWRLWDQGNQEAARAAFALVASAGPEGPEGVRKTELLFATPEVRLARHLETSAPSVVVRDSRALFQAANDRLMVGDASAALPFLREATEIDSGFEMAWFNLGVAAWKTKRWEEAVDAFRRASQLKPNRAESFQFLGSALRELGRCREAMPPLRRALELRPDLGNVGLMLADCQRRLGR